MSGYHKAEIPKGVLGEFSKIVEEFLEAEDAHAQGNPIMTLCELSDLIGAIEAYAARYQISLDEIITMTRATESAFESGRRQ